MRKALMLAAAMLPVGAGAVEPRLPGPVTYEVRSWGRLILHWQVNPDGTGEIWKPAAQKDRGVVRKFRLRLEGDALRAFATNVEDVREAASGGIDCRRDITDLPYGSITWDYPGARQAYAFDAGCRSEKADRAMEILGAASTVVETMARIDADPYVMEPVPSR